MLPSPEKLRDLPLGRKLRQWPIATQDHLPAPLVARDAGRGVIEAGAWVRDGHEGHAGFRVAEFEPQVRRMDPEGVLQVLQVRGREREGAVSLGSDIVANDHWGKISVHLVAGAG